MAFLSYTSKDFANSWLYKVSWCKAKICLSYVVMILILLRGAFLVLKWMSFPINDQRFIQIETNQFISSTISSANQLTGFYSSYMMVTLIIKGLIRFLKRNSKKQFSKYYLLKVNNGNTRKRFEICSKLTIAPVLESPDLQPATLLKRDSSTGMII